LRTRRTARRELAEADQVQTVARADPVVVGRSENVSASSPCFFRFDSWMRAKLRAITAQPPSSRGESAACSRLLPSP
jgi:hypothetical protein